jgi:hypothetical protein
MAAAVVQRCSRDRRALLNAAVSKSIGGRNKSDPDGRAGMSVTTTSNAGNLSVRAHGKIEFYLI